MTFINPIEILDLQDLELSSIDNTIIKKAKKKLFADIDLSDNSCLNYRGQYITKSDCEQAIEELENRKIKEFCLHLATEKKLNNYLAKNDESIFTPFKQEYIYQLPEFIRFINPHFALRFDKSLLSAFKEFDSGKIKSILRTLPLIEISEYNVAFKSLSYELQNRIEEVDKITSEIKNQESKYSDDNIQAVINLVKELFPIDCLNLLPAYFLSQVNKIANAINNLSVAVWNDFNLKIVPFKLAGHLLELNIDSIDKVTFEKNYALYKKIYEEREEQEKNAPVLKKWASILSSIQSQIKLVEDKSLKASIALEKTKQLFNLSELNNLPPFAKEIRTQISYAIRDLSIGSWNKQNDIKIALEFISYALEINISDETKAKLRRDKKDLEEIETKNKGILVCYFCDNNSPDEKSKFRKTIYKETYRTFSGRTRRVMFDYTEITVPRCTNCKEVHLRSSVKHVIIFCSLMILGIIIGACTNNEHFISWGIAGIVAGGIVGKIVATVELRKAKIKSISNSTLRKHPLFFEKMKQGWTFSKPSA
jgi:hypothetical protein